MERVKVSTLEPLLKLPGNGDPNSICADASVLSCGCVISESYFASLVDVSGRAQCPDCATPNVSFLKPVKQLRELYKIITLLQTDIPVNSAHRRRRSSSKKSIKGVEPAELMDMISLFYKYAKEETTQSDPFSSVTPSVEPIDIKLQKHILNNIMSSPVSPMKNFSPSTRADSFSYPRNSSIKYEDVMLSSLSEEKEYNFSKCFPFHRKLTTFQTLLGKLLSANPFSSVIKKGSRFIGSDINTFTDRLTGQEVTRIVLITEKKWELYELSDGPDLRPILLCCGKLSGEFGSLYGDLRDDLGHEVVIKSDFSGNENANKIAQDSEYKKKLSLWELVSCKLSPDFLAIAGTKGVMRVLNISKASLPYEMGKPVYTYITNFPIRCLAISSTYPLVACSITAKERISGKEQPFVVLHKLIRSTGANRIIESAEPITITIPYRDPIKIITFNNQSTHLLCCSVWESRYLVIRLRSIGSDNFKKPRLIWSDSSAYRSSKRKKADGTYDDADEDNSDDDALMMDNEGITDAQFGAIPNTLILTSCSLQLRPPILLRLEGSTIDSSVLRYNADAISLDSSLHSRTEVAEEEVDISNVKSADQLLKFQEVGFSIHKMAILPRRDALAFLDKDGKIYLVSMPNYETLSSSSKKVVVLLGEVSNAERYVEAASIKFSADGGRVYVADRKGVILVFDFTKGVPGHDADVVKCKIINV